jgi:nuclear GTP-binding protein
MNLLSNYCRNHDIKTSITVGVVGNFFSEIHFLSSQYFFSGFPNVGKSSVINSLKRSQACETGSMPGITKYIDIILLNDIKILF